MKIHIKIQTQTLFLFADTGELLQEFKVSTAKNGVGEESGSYCTPRGLHRIQAKIGSGQAENTVFVKRRPAGEIYTSALALAHPRRDWILTRILWLKGLESGYNQGGTCDTQRRYIYIHGTPDSTEMGKPGSHGCVRMRNADLLILFEQISVGTELMILT